MERREDAVAEPDYYFDYFVHQYVMVVYVIIVVEPCMQSRLWWCCPVWWSHDTCSRRAHNPRSRRAHNPRSRRVHNPCSRRAHNPRSRRAHNPQRQCLFKPHAPAVMQQRLTVEKSPFKCTRPRRMASCRMASCVALLVALWSEASLCWPRTCFEFGGFQERNSSLGGSRRGIRVWGVLGNVSSLVGARKCFEFGGC
ncbi:uncharacterized protein M421DRAFT_172971 [Didymella exigua CBS 183.55]|uniref:Uncharacterized protein n=1 Tax=Didymella exigua CBS 183.55 TaxID=1150837 RepID=A0A6A5RJR1_9PLEO|nr:uncharacterized protein M421DRAFT_172971 [Didymella exigua CBS 183.55]KAF1927683.1 hypothetical protein M421DRAFT_172971 [Didymella exigua CBS 183.55]